MTNEDIARQFAEFADRLTVSETRARECEERGEAQCRRIDALELALAEERVKTGRMAAAIADLQLENRRLRGTIRALEAMIQELELTVTDYHDAKVRSDRVADEARREFVELLRQAKH